MNYTLKVMISDFDFQYECGRLEIYYTSKEVLIYIRRETHEMLMLFIEDKKFTNHKAKKVTSYNKAFVSIHPTDT